MLNTLHTASHNVLHGMQTMYFRAMLRGQKPDDIGLIMAFIMLGSLSPQGNLHALYVCWVICLQHLIKLLDTGRETN